jgi:hypothetical protein
MMICASRTVHVKISSSSGFVAQPGIKALDEFGYVPLSTRDAECLFEVFSQRYERGSPTGTSNPPFDGWAGVFGSERPTGALRDRLTQESGVTSSTWPPLFAYSHETFLLRPADASFLRC